MVIVYIIQNRIKIFIFRLEIPVFSGYNIAYDFYISLNTWQISRKSETQSYRACKMAASCIFCCKTHCLMGWCVFFLQDGVDEDFDAARVQSTALTP